MNREFHYRWEWRLRSSPQALWPSIADTNRFNMETGLPQVERADARHPLALVNARRRLKFTKLGLTVEWEEEPFEWVEPYCFGVVRTYSRGPVETMRVRADLTELEDGGTRLVYQVWAEPRNLLGVMAIPIQIGMVSARSFANVFRQFDSQLSRGESASGLSSRGGGTVKFTPGGRERLLAAHKDILGEGVDTQLADQLIDLVEHADELAASQLRPYELADIWGLPRKSVLEAFLVATRIGLLEFEWHLLCPLCRGAKAKSASLAGIEPQVHCDTCNIDFEVNFDRAVELTFHPNPSIRHILMGEFCIAGPRVTPHVILQQLLPAGECREVAIGLEGGRYRLRTLRLPGGRYLVAGPGGAASIHLPMTDATWPGDEPTVALQSTLSLDNRTGEEQLLILERLAFTDLAVTGAEVTALQRFRDLFASEALRPGERISVGSLAVLFTDLYGSTQLYNKTGDATAFGQVMRHFDYLKKAIADHDGTLTKTMGDAIMAVFRRPVDAVQAVFEAQQALAAAKGELGQLHLKAGIHFGHAIAVTMNDRLDYFGSTINMAARLQGLSRGSDLVLSEAVYGDDEVAALPNATASALRVEDFIVDIRGFEEQEFSLRRLALKHLPVPE